MTNFIVGHWSALLFVVGVLCFVLAVRMSRGILLGRTAERVYGVKELSRITFVSWIVAHGVLNSRSMRHSYALMWLSVGLMAVAFLLPPLL